jgi:LmbE family N-acetylglucosaminyl deacetylase
MTPEPLEFVSRGSLLVISPHMDDAVLSCAGLVAAAPAAAVATVFGGFPPVRDRATPEENTPGSTEWDQSCGFKPGDDVVGLRRDEDRAALRILGARPLWLDFLDSQYVVEPHESATPADIGDRLRAVVRDLAPATIAFPLGISHTDHQRTHEAAVLLLEKSPELASTWVAFTDVPYRAWFPDLVTDRLAQLKAKGFELVPFGLDTDLKAAALAEYGSQLLGLAGGLPNAALPEEYYLLQAR